MMLDDTIKALRSITFTLTPEKVDYSKYEHFNSMIRNVKSAAKSNQFDQFTDQEIEAIITYSLHLLEIPEDLGGVRLAIPCTKYLLTRAFSQLFSPQSKWNLDSQSIEQPFFNVIDKWNEELERSDLKILGKRPSINRSFPLSFHLSAYEESTMGYEPKANKRSKRKKEFEPFMYIAFGYVFHRKLMAKLNRIPKDSTKGANELAVRNAFEYASDSVRMSQEHVQDDYTRILTDDWQKNYRESEPSRTRTTDITAEEKFRIFDSIMDIRQKPASKSIQVKRRSRDDDPDDGEAPDGGPGESPGKIHKRRDFVHGLKDEHGDENAKYEPDLDYFPDFTIPIVQRAGKKPRAFWHDAPHSRYVSFFWDVHGLNTGHYSFLYEAIEKATYTSVEMNSVTLYLRLLMHTGCDTKMLRDLYHENTDAPADSMELKKVDGRYYLLVPSQVSLAEPPTDSFCRPVSSKVHVPIPDVFQKLIPDKAADGKHVFSYIDKGTRKPRCLKLSQVTAFLNQINRNYAINSKIEGRYQHGLDLKLRNIAYSFFTLYTDYSGLDPIIACHVSGWDHRDRFGPQLHYIHVQHQQLEKAYLETFNQVDYAVRKNRYELFREGVLREKAINPLNKTVKIVPHTTLPGYGSPYIPDEPYVAGLMGTIRYRIVAEKDQVRRHNLYIVYLYLALQFATTLRPHNSPELHWHHYNRRAGYIIIADKESGKCREERILFLPQVIQNLLNRLQDGWRAFSETGRRKLCLSSQHNLAENIFFAINEEGELYPFMLQMIREVFHNIGLEFKLPTNMPRHYTRTRLHDDNIDNAIADILMGHVRAGREVFNILSTTRLSDVAGIYLPVINKMLEDISITDVEYLAQ